MKLAIATCVVAILALPATATPVELVCNGTLTRSDEIGLGTPINGMHLLVGNKTVVVSGGNHLDPVTYTVDAAESDAASLVFSSGRWFGILNRYSGELSMLPEPDTNRRRGQTMLEAKCGKAEPLF